MPYAAVGEHYPSCSCGRSFAMVCVSQMPDGLPQEYHPYEGSSEGQLAAILLHGMRHTFLMQFHRCLVLFRSSVTVCKCLCITMPRVFCYLVSPFGLCCVRCRSQTFASPCYRGIIRMFSPRISSPSLLGFFASKETTSPKWRPILLHRPSHHHA